MEIRLDLETGSLDLRKVYAPPEIVHELSLETRAGSPLRMPSDLVPGVPPDGINN